MDNKYNYRNSIMEDKREISLKRAKELHDEIADYLEFKEQYISDVS